MQLKQISQDRLITAVFVGGAMLAVVPFEDMMSPILRLVVPIIAIIVSWVLAQIVYKVCDRKR
jgi:hypothetical protein